MKRKPKIPTTITHRYAEKGNHFSLDFVEPKKVIIANACSRIVNCSFARMPVGRTRKGKLAATIVRHSIAAASVVSDEDGNASECGESTLESNVATVNAAYNNQQQQQQHSNELKCISNKISQGSDEDDQNQNDANNLNLSELDLKLSNGENVACK